MMQFYFSKKQFIFLLIKFFVVLSLSPSISLAAVPPMSSSPKPPAPAPSQELVSYKAHYKLSLGVADADSAVSDVEGTMTVEFKDVCDGWTIQQNSEILVTTQEGADQKIKWNYVTWESKDGKLFRFNMRRFLDGSVEDDIRGIATIDPKNHEGKAVYEKPYYFTQKLSASVLFPTAHFIQLLNAAKAGEKLLSCIVFDGSTLEGASEINAFIGLAHTPPKKNPQDPAYPFWPIRFAIHGPHNTGEGPDLESAQQIMQNGVPLEYIIDYGDFKIKGTLEKYDLLKGGC